MRSQRAMHRRLLVAAVSSLCVVAAAPTAASAQSGGASFPTVFVTAKTARGQFQGAFEIRRFRVRGPGLAVFGRLSGTLRDSRYPSAQRVRRRPFSFDVTAGRPPGARTCARVAIAFAGRTAPVFGLAATFAPRTLVLRPRRGTGPSTGALLCGTSSALAANAPPAVTVHLLNALRLQYG
jgi:hypothetical protein